MNEGTQGKQYDPRQARFSWRLTFRYDGLKLELIKQRRVAVITPARAGRPPVAGRDSGAWLELRDAAGSVLFHRDVKRMMGMEVEVHQPDGTMKTVIGTPGQGTFELLVPDLPQALTVHLLSSPLEGKRQSEPAAELRKFALRPDSGKDGHHGHE